jgi:RNA polymerase sigma-70 factor (ECF subfamily)
MYLELVSYANGYLFDKASSEDLVQNVFIFLWEKSDKIENLTNIKAYLYATVRNKSYNKLKAIKITDTSKILEAQTTFSMNYSTSWALEEEKEISYQRALMVIESLPAKMRIIVKLRFIENYHYKEIADELNVSLNTVKTQLKRAKVKLANVVVSLITVFTIV